MSDYDHTPWMTITDATEYSQFGEKVIRHALQDGELQGYQRRAPRGPWRIHRDDIDSWIRGEHATSRPHLVRT